MMKTIKLLCYFLFMFLTFLTIQSCEKDPCEEVNCLNNGICNEGLCDCPIGYIGANCGTIDTSKIQELLDQGVSPRILYLNGVGTDQLYGKTYEGGLIFAFGIISGAGMVASPMPITEKHPWPCSWTDIVGLYNVSTDPPTSGSDNDLGARVGDGFLNTYRLLNQCNEEDTAPRLCLDHGDGWYLPSRGELNLLLKNLILKGHAPEDFYPYLYWSSTEINSFAAWGQSFLTGEIGRYGKSSEVYVWPIKNFD